MATEAELETVDTEGQSAPAVTSQKSVTISDPAVVALSEVKLSSQKTTNKSYKSDCSNITRPEGYLPVGQRPSVPLVQSTIGITSEWLTEVYTMRGFLKEGGKVTSCNVKPLGEGEGVMGLCVPGSTRRRRPTRSWARRSRRTRPRAPPLRLAPGGRVSCF